MSKSKVLILARNDQWHQLEHLGEMITNWLKAEGISSVALTNDRAVLAGDINRYDLMIFCMTPEKFSPEEEDSIVNFVEDGKKFMGIHSATVVSEENTKYIEMIGGRFSHHDEYREFTVKIAAPGHPVVEGVDDFKIQDELYVIERTPSSASVLLTAFFEHRSQPLVFLKAYGQGKVLYNSLGHDRNAYENPNFKRIVVQGVKWLLR